MYSNTGKHNSIVDLQRMQNTNNYMPSESMNDLSTHQAIESSTHSYGAASSNNINSPSSKTKAVITPSNAPIIQNLWLMMFPKVFKDIFSVKLFNTPPTTTVHVLSSVSGMMVGLIDLKHNAFIASILMFAYSACAMHVIQKSKRHDDEKVTAAATTIKETEVVPWYDEDKMLPDTQLPTRNEMYDYYSQFTSSDEDGSWNEDVDVVDPKDVGTPDEWIKRHPQLIRLTGRHPFNSEPPLSVLMKKGFLTPASLHYVRNHGPPPKGSWKDHRISLGGLCPSPIEISMSDLWTLPRHSVAVLLVCCGNRRKEQVGKLYYMSSTLLYILSDYT